jgi:hypothetical protein
MNKVYPTNAGVCPVSTFSIDRSALKLGYREVFIGTVLYENGRKAEVLIQEEDLLLAFNYFLACSQVTCNLYRTLDGGDKYISFVDRGQQFEGFYIRYYDENGMPFRVDFE